MGPVERMNEYGMTEMRGYLVNGLESGLFREYDKEGKVVWIGYYRNGQRYSEVMKAKHRKGYYDERIVESGELVSTAEYDKKFTNKHGHCYDYENGAVKRECIYENGRIQRIFRQFQNERMIVYSAFGEVIHEGAWRGDVTSGYFFHEPMEGMKGFFKEVNASGELVSVSEYDDLNVYKNGQCYELANGEVRQVCVYEMDRLHRVIREFNDATMTEYNVKGQKVYEGEFKGDLQHGFVRHGKGNEFDGRSRMAVYTGEWRNGKREGQGTEFRGFKPVYSGGWKGGLWHR